MQSTTKAGYKNKISSYFINSFEKDSEGNDDVYDASKFNVDLEEFEIRKYVVALQAAWRSRTARIMVGALKQEANCVNHRKTHPELHATRGALVTDCQQCAQGDSMAELRQKLNRQKFIEIERLLFAGQKKVTIYDTGENWNQRFQKIILLPEDTQLERSSKFIALNALNKDFVSTAKTYAKTIISEYFLHVKDKGIVCKNMGGVAGGQKYLWRGILFKMANGSSGPFNGSDEAASKAAGHDLKGSVHYSNCGVRELHVPLIALIDYKGFRMSAQAFLPLGENSMVYGSADAGATVLKTSDRFNAAMEKAAAELNIRKHVVGRRGQVKELHSAVDVEGHIGLDNRLYLLDLSRTFPPESPAHTKHLSDLFPDGSRVMIEVPQDFVPNSPSKNGLPFAHGSGGPGALPTHKMMSATVHNAYAHGEFYDLLFEDGSIVQKFPASMMHSKGVSIFWRFLRPEYVKFRGRDLVALTNQDVVGEYDNRNETSKRTGVTETFALTNENISKLPKISKERGRNVSAQSETDSLGYDDFSTDVGSLEYDGFSSSDSAGSGDSLAYDDFNSAISVGSLDYDNFSSRACSVDGVSDQCAEGSSDDARATSLRLAGIETSRDEELSAAYDVFDAGYGPFSSVIHDDVLSNHKSNVDANEPSTSDTPAGGQSGVLRDLRTPPGSNFSPSLSQGWACGVTRSELPKPLSSDALSSFSNLDPDALERNSEIDRATARLVTEVIPALAARLAAMSSHEVSNLDLSVYFHSCGVNMRHLGLVRFHVSSTHASNPVKTLLLLQIVTRTLKNLCREYQRRWMKSEQSTSEMGMKLLLTQFLNLMVGSSPNSEVFWTERVVVGIIQRFGACSIDNNIDHLHRIRKLPEFLKAMLKMFVGVIGLTLHDRAMNQFMNDESPFQFEFIVQDIASLEPTVKSMHVVDYGTGLMLHELAAEGHATGEISERLLQRIQELADKSFLDAYKVMPSHASTVQRVEEIWKKNKERELV
mmetsp:Transcript_9515/g.17842  ORF Transcript_9515/g.17842 Transcript_9515/m.17842 type:complete len:990 (+) Transcript_9515:148-3117(+)